MRTILAYFHLMKRDNILAIFHPHVSIRSTELYSTVLEARKKFTNNSNLSSILAHNFEYRISRHPITGETEKERERERESHPYLRFTAKTAAHSPHGK